MNITGIILFVILIVRNFEKRKDRIHLKLVTRNVFTNEKMLITGFSSISHQCLPYNLIKLHNFRLYPKHCPPCLCAWRARSHVKTILYGSLQRTH